MKPAISSASGDLSGVSRFFRDQSMAMVSCCLPEEMVIEILLRLPVKSLMRFKCVCKRWCALTRNPSVIAMHLNSNSSSRRVSWNGNSNGLIVGHDGYHVFPKCSRGLQPVNLNFGMEQKPNFVYGPCDGIFCLCWFPPEIIECNCRLPTVALWNPATREFNMLPMSSFEFPPFKLVRDCIIGFGFDRKTKSYKVVKVVGIWQGCQECVNCAEVYTLSSDSWRVLPLDVSFQNVQICSEGLVCTYTNNGFFHWSLNHNDENEFVVVSFDMGEEVFRVTPLPKKYNAFPASVDRVDHSLTFLKNSLAMVCSFLKERYTSIELWVMKDYYDNKVDNVDQESRCWSLEFTLESLPGIQTSLGFWNNNELLIRRNYLGEEYCGRPFLYDIVTKQARYLQLSGEPNFMYRESLVSVNGGK